MPSPRKVAEIEADLVHANVKQTAKKLEACSKCGMVLMNSKFGLECECGVGVSEDRCRDD